MTWRTKIFYGDVLMFHIESPDAEYVQGAVNRFLDDKKRPVSVIPVSPSPVRTETVTKRHIVPGVYGRLRVGNCYGAGVWVEVTEGKGGSLALTATELDDLAMVASQLAEALRDVD